MIKKYYATIKFRNNFKHGFIAGYKTKYLWIDNGYYYDFVDGNYVNGIFMETL